MNRRGFIKKLAAAPLLLLCPGADELLPDDYVPENDKSLITLHNGTDKPETASRAYHGPYCGKIISYKVGGTEIAYLGTDFKWHEL